MFDGAGLRDATLAFGPFTLSPCRRLLLESGQPVRIGSRALELLIALTERAGELITRAELTSRLWPTTMVIGANLSVQMTALRRALRDGRDGNRYIVNEPGRGYRFVAPVGAADEPRRMAGSTSQCVFPDQPLVLALAEACSMKQAAALRACPRYPSTEEDDAHKALDSVLQRAIRALELARALLSIDPPASTITEASGRAAH